ncbi:MAG: 4-(cytidine 5'-diphospho)-2-C-methyl-D-erythritol kinase [Candidatus Obscuribacterales bacterium]|nr:4-(cytidine 5'-diphospho)-2-C-methyl-D-erythritol kinase [Candidatus Obscuribacterales bacterium]
MRSITVRCPAKINLTFDIIARRNDGYHDIETLFQSIDLEDQIQFQFEAAPSYSFELRCENPYVRRAMPLDGTNLIARAAGAFFKNAGVDENWCITAEIEKNIPIAAGLAGGSSNAAGTLHGLNEFFNRPLTGEQLHHIGGTIGADIPFCLSGGTAIGRGKGDLLSKVADIEELTYVIVKPRKLAVSTPEAYASYHHYKGEIRRPNLQAALSGLQNSDIELALSAFGNVLEPVIFEQHSELAELKKTILHLGAWYCQMSGSGPTLFAVVPSREMGHHIRRELLHDDELGFFYGTGDVLNEGLPPLDVRIAQTCKHGVHALQTA